MAGGVDGADPGAIDLEANGALEEFDGEDETVLALDLDELTLDAGHRAEDDGNPFACLEIGPRSGADVSGDGALDGGNFGFVDGLGNAGEADDGFDAGSGKDGEAAFDIESTENIARKEWCLNLFDSVRILAAVEVGWQKDIDVFLFEGLLDAGFGTSTDADGVPGK